MAASSFVIVGITWDDAPFCIFYCLPVAEEDSSDSNGLQGNDRSCVETLMQEIVVISISLPYGAYIIIICFN